VLKFDVFLVGLAIAPGAPAPPGSLGTGFTSSSPVPVRVFGLPNPGEGIYRMTADQAIVIRAKVLPDENRYFELEGATALVLTSAGDPVTEGACQVDGRLLTYVASGLDAGIYDVRFVLASASATQLATPPIRLLVAPAP
jgi:hypothetical protein